MQEEDEEERVFGIKLSFNMSSTDLNLVTLNPDTAYVTITDRGGVRLIGHYIHVG